jgi:hypothetical protein
MRGVEALAIPNVAHDLWERSGKFMPLEAKNPGLSIMHVFERGIVARPWAPLGKAMEAENDIHSINLLRLIVFGGNRYRER